MLQKICRFEIAWLQPITLQGTRQLSNVEKIRRRQKNTICSPDSKCIRKEGPKFQWGKFCVDTEEKKKKNLNGKDGRALKEIPQGSCGFCKCLSLTRGYINFCRLWHILIVCLEALNFFQPQFQILWFSTTLPLTPASRSPTCCFSTE